MIFRLVVLVLVVVLSTTTALGDEKFILRHDVIVRQLQDDQCPSEGFVAEQYKIEIDLYNVDDGCDDNDLVELGNLLDESVKEAESLVPHFDDEFMETTMCTDPSAVLHHEKPRDDRRRLGRYRVKYGGLCRRCRPDYERRLFQLSSTGENGEYSSSNVKLGDTDRKLTQAEICEMSNAAGQMETPAEKDLNACNAAFVHVSIVVEIVGDDDPTLDDLFQKAEEQQQLCDKSENMYSRGFFRLMMLCNEAKNLEKENLDTTEVLEEAMLWMETATTSRDATSTALTAIAEISNEVDKNARYDSRERICRMATLAKRGEATAKKYATEAGVVKQETIALAKKVKDEDKKATFIKKAKKFVRKCDYQLRLAVEASEAADLSCREAKSTTSKSKLSNLSEVSEKLYKDALASGKTSQDNYYWSLGNKKQVKMEIYLQTYNVEFNKAKSDFEANEEPYYVQETKKIKQEIWALTQELENEREEDDRKALEAKIQDLESKKDDVTFEYNRAKFDAYQKMSMEKWKTQRLYDVEASRSEDRWERRFLGLVKAIAQTRLFDEYSLPDGCLTSIPKADVVIYKLENGQGTQDECAV